MENRVSGAVRLSAVMGRRAEARDNSLVVRGRGIEMAKARFGVAGSGRAPPGDGESLRY